MGLYKNIHTGENAGLLCESWSIDLPVELYVIYLRGSSLRKYSLAKRYNMLALWKDNAHGRIKWFGVWDPFTKSPKGMKHQQLAALFIATKHNALLEFSPALNSHSHVISRK